VRHQCWRLAGGCLSPAVQTINKCLAGGNLSPAVQTVDKSAFGDQMASPSKLKKGLRGTGNSVGQKSGGGGGGREGGGGKREREREKERETETPRAPAVHRARKSCARAAAAGAAASAGRHKSARRSGEEEKVEEEEEETRRGEVSARLARQGHAWQLPCGPRQPMRRGDSPRRCLALRALTRWSSRPLSGTPPATSRARSPCRPQTLPGRCRCRRRSAAGS